MLRSPLLERFDWLEHGFGERTDAIDQAAMASLKQIHSNWCFVVQQPGAAGEGDALVTGAVGLAISVRTADCMPILLVDSATRAIAAIHAGWRGTVGEIAGEALKRMQSEYGTRPENVFAAAGPGIGACCYEVGPDVGCHFGLAEKGKVDLAAANRDQLMRVGVPAAHIDTAGACTFCDATRFFSWRRDRERAGRMISYVKRVR